MADLQMRNNGRSEFNAGEISTLQPDLADEKFNVPLKTSNGLNRDSGVLGEASTKASGGTLERHKAARDGLSPMSSQSNVDIDPQAHCLQRSEMHSSPAFPTADQEAVTANNGLSAHTPREEEYMDPTPKTPRLSRSPTQLPADEASGPRPSPTTRSSTHSGSHNGGEERDEGYDNRETSTESVAGNGNEDSRSEIQSIMGQFESTGGSPDEDDIMSPRLQITSPNLQTPIHYPPRKSSLEPVQPVQGTSLPSPEQATSISTTGDLALLEHRPNAETERNPSVPSIHPPQTTRSISNDPRNQLSSQSPVSLQKAPPPEPDPEPVLPFDFHRFLEQLRHRTADPVAKFLRSFLVEFGKKQWMVHEQVKIISDFLAFITNKMAQCEVWRGVSDAEFDNAKEGMEKLVMNRLYTQTFSPAIPPTPPAQDLKGKRKNLEKLQGPARKGQHQEDIERDEILGQKVRIYGWIEEPHLDIPPVEESGRRFLSLAQQGRWTLER